MKLKQRLAQRTNDAALDARYRWRQFAARKIRGVLSAWGDPLITIEVGPFRLRAPLSHQLPHYQRADERYGRNIGVLARLLAEQSPGATMIDIGANIGDTAATARCFAPALPILCIEGSPSFAPILKQNLATWPNVEFEAPLLLGEQTGEVVGQLSGTEGTAHLDQSEGGVAAISTLDDVVESHPRFSNPALVKSDTDGFEARVLAGSQQVLERARPVLFVEYAPELLARSGIGGLEMIAWLRDLGYGPAVIYDNFGYPMCNNDIRNIRLIDDLHRYARSKPFFYLDLALFPAGQPELAEELYAREDSR